MAKLILEPYAARLTWRFPEPQPPRRWQALFAALLDEVARTCATEESRVIGHIKGLGVMPDGGFLRGSTVGAQRPADVDLYLGPHGSSAELEMTLNVLVYGLPAGEAGGIVREIGLALAVREGARVDVAPVESQEDPHHHDE